MVSSSFSDEVVSVTKLRKEMTAMLEKVRSGVPVTIMQGDTADVAIVRRGDYSKLEEDVRKLSRQIADLESEIETLEVMADPELMDSISAGLTSYKASETIALDELLGKGS